VPTVSRAESTTSLTIPTGGLPIDELLAKQWLLTNGLGGYSASTIAGCNTSGYHGLLVGALSPPVRRVMSLSNCLEMLIFGRLRDQNGSDTTEGDSESVIELSTFEFDNGFAPRGWPLLRSFRRGLGAHFEFESEKFRLVKSLYLLRQSNTILVEYSFERLAEPAELIVRPFVAIRDFHSVQKSFAPLTCQSHPHSVLVSRAVPSSPELLICSPQGRFEKDAQWWFNFVYRQDRQRRGEWSEDLWTPGFFRWRLGEGDKVFFWADISERYEPAHTATISPKVVVESLTRHRQQITQASTGRDATFRQLCLAADQFIVKRQTSQGWATTLVAGYPWFGDWGRDAFVSLPGLLLETGRFQEARSLLISFAGAADKGMIPNYFDDYEHRAHYNSVDASLWFIDAAFRYLEATGDSQTFAAELLGVIRWIVDSYQQGTRFGIHADGDGLVCTGDERMQLTWMDAKSDGVPVTPRCGKAVEVEALWYNALCLLCRYYAGKNTELARHYRAMAELAGQSFNRLFWNEQRNCLYDCIAPDGHPEPALRPNQIFAVSLRFSALSAQRQRAVVDIVERHLLTPYGLRSLEAADERYHRVYSGLVAERDRAYHQGTVWAYLIGPFVEAYLKVNKFSARSKKTAAEFIQPLLDHFRSQDCIASVSEIFDGDPPHRPRGCAAQAWSVGELIRAYRLIHG